MSSRHRLTVAPIVILTPTNLTRALVSVALLALVVVGLAGCGSQSGLSSSAQTLDVSVNAAEFKFDPAAITAAPGQTINLTLKNVGRAPHTWVLKQANVRLTVDPGKTATRSFRAPPNPGTFPIYCDVPGHKEAGQVGTLLVK